MPVHVSYFLLALRATLALWLGFIAFASLVPFNWSLDAASMKAVWAFLDPNPFRARTGRASLAFDAGLNVLLFVPIGFGLWIHDHLAPLKRLSRKGLLFAGLIFAIALQALQLYLPRRVASLSDAVWNGIGLLAGAALAWLAWKTWQELAEARIRRAAKRSISEGR